LATAKTIFSSETDWPNGAKLCRKHLCNVLYKVPSFRSVWPTNMVVKSNYCFWMANIKKSSSLKLLGQIKPNLTGSIYVRFSMKFGSIWPISFRGEDCFSSSQSETRIVLGGHICSRDEMKQLDRAGCWRVTLAKKSPCGCSLRFVLVPKEKWKSPCNFTKSLC
jgi:hypothetical protein